MQDSLIQAALDSVDCASTLTQRSQLADYAALLQQWNKKINLIGKSTEHDLWQRHIADAAQLISYLSTSEQRNIVDCGSGAGIPGIVMAILLTRYRLTLVESDQRKAAFLRQAISSLGLENVSVESSRLEHWRPDKPPSIIVARALAPIDKLLGWTEHLITPSTQYWLHKGERVDKELSAAKEKWLMTDSIFRVV